MMFGKFREQGVWIARNSQWRMLFARRYLYLAVGRVRLRLDFRRREIL